MWNPLRLLFGPEAAMATMGDGRPDNSSSDMEALTKAFHEAHAKRMAAQGSSGGFTSLPAITVPPPDIRPTQPMPPMQGLDMPWAPPMPQPRPAAADVPKVAPASPQAAPIPMPQARPAEAPQPQPDTSFFMRNALSMRDPASGDNGFIDPAGAASVRGPDLINKMMTYLHKKDMG